MTTGHFTRVVWLAAALVAGSPLVPSIAQTTGAAPPVPGIGLTADHKRTIYREIGQEQARRVPDGSPVAIGAEVPDSLMLNEMPISVKDKIGLLRDFKFAKLPDETILIVDPAKRQIVDLVTKDEGTR
jgi:hypothetical protein